MVSSREVFAFIESASPVCPRNPTKPVSTKPWLSNHDNADEDRGKSR